MTNPPIEEVKEVISEVIEEIQHGNLVTDHQVRPLLKAAEAYCEMQWRPIETAPKDGRTVMLMQWNEIMPKVYSAFWMPLEKNEGYIDEGYLWILNDDDDIMVEEDSDLSIWFWAPLPNPPKENQE